MNKSFSKFLKSNGIDVDIVPRGRVEEVEIDVTGQEPKIIRILDECSIKWEHSPNRYGGASDIVSAVADYWTLLTMLYAIYKSSNTNISFYVKVKGSAKPIKMIIADYLRYLADRISSEQ